MLFKMFDHNITIKFQMKYVKFSFFQAKINVKNIETKSKWKKLISHVNWSAPTLRHLRCQRRRDGDEAELAAAVVNRHLLALAHVIDVGVALVAELLQGEAAVH